jgi:hypothetical protein
MGRAFPTMSNAGGPAGRREVWNSAHVVQLFAIVLLTATSLFLPAVGTATSFVALIDGTNHRLVVAADCRVSLRSASLSGCKIVEEAGCTAVIRGLYRESTTAVSKPPDSRFVRSRGKA